MHTLTTLRLVTLLAVSAGSVAFSQIVPGEDPLRLTRPVTHLGAPIGGGPRSSDLEKNTELKGSLRAKIARFEAKAFSLSPDDSIVTDEDVISASATQGVRRVCRQDVGSNTTTPGIGRNPTTNGGRGTNEQIVVLRGDLVNICR
jgi:hypothetical protein